MRVNNVSAPNGRCDQYEFPSIKLQRTVSCRNALVRDCALHLEYHPLVTRYEEWPCEIRYRDENGDQCRYVPDFLAELDDGTEVLIATTPRAELARMRARVKLESVAHRLEHEGRLFRVWPEDNVRREPLLSNLKRIHEAAAHGALDGDAPLVALPKGEKWTLGEFIRAMTSETRAFALLGLGYVRANLEEELTDGSQVSLEGVEGSHDGSFRM